MFDRPPGTTPRKTPWQTLHRTCAIAACIVGTLVLSGCGNGKDVSLASVSGRVTFNGQPLSGATVEFQPLKGSPSFGVTDTDGRYTLKFTRQLTGAVLGEHQVRIRTARLTADAAGNDVLNPETIPAHYNAQSQLKAKVESRNSDINFDLNSDNRVAAHQR